MPGILLLPEVLWKFLGSGVRIFPICPGFCDWLQFSGNFRALAVGISLYARDFAPAGNSQEISGHWWWDFPYMPGILWLAPILKKFLGSGVRIFPICPGFCGWLQFSRNFWAVVVGFSLYARDFIPAGSSQEISGQWWWDFPYMPGILWLAPILKKFPGTGGGNFPICPGFCSRRQFSGNFRALVVGTFLYARNFTPAGNSQKFSGQ